MNYVKQLDINGVEARQTACVELHGAPNAATEAAVGVLGMDIDSPTHEVYKCVAVNGAIHVWEKLGGSGGNSPELEAKIEALEEQIADILYKEVSITSFNHNAGTKEYGATVSSLTLSWAINKTPTTLTLDGASIDVSDTSKALSGLSITKDSGKTWKLVATDERGAKSEKTTSITFCNGVYYGVKAVPGTYDSTFIRGLTKELRSNKKPSFNVTAGAGEYIYYCLPTRMGACIFAVGGFTGGFSLVDTISFTNGSGYTESYYIYRSDNANLGNTSVTVS